MRTEKTYKDIFDSYELADINSADYNLVLGHKRLSIIDLSFSGHQPMQGIDNSWIVFNGEIYNYIELKEELKILGAQFKTKSDTEVVLEAYRIWGKECLNKFNGMWTICIWDAPQKRLFINNDRFGLKPLYYLEHDNGLNLVSELKQLKCFNSGSLLLNRKHIEEFTNYGFLDVDESSMYENVFRFKKSHYLIIDPLQYFKQDIKLKQIPYYLLKKVAVEISEKDADDVSVAKIIVDNNYYLNYISRAKIPHNFKNIPNIKYKKHVSIIIIPNKYLKKYFQCETSSNQLLEDNEWLRFIDIMKCKIKCIKVDDVERDINTIEDLEYLKKKYEN